MADLRCFQVTCLRPEDGEGGTSGGLLRETMEWGKGLNFRSLNYLHFEFGACLYTFGLLDP